MALLSRDDRRDPAAVGVAALLAAWFWAGAVNNVPVKGFDRFRKKVSIFTIWLPNWRFFAPNPIQHDNHLIYRLSTVGGEITPWFELELYHPRRWWYAVIHPGKRRFKALNDVVNVVLSSMRRYPMRYVQGGDYYRLLQEFVRHEVDLRHRAEAPRGFQFAVVRYSGYDDSTEPDYQIVSAYEPAQPAA